MIDDLLFELFGSIRKVDDYSGFETDYSVYQNDDFIINVEKNKNNEYLISVDLSVVFNKVSQSPINFIYNGKLSKRKKQRIFQAVNHLLRNRQIAGGFFGRMDGFDDLDYTNMIKFYEKH